MDGADRAHVFSVAGDRIRRVVFVLRCRCSKASPELQDAFPQIYKDVIEIPDTGSLYRVLSADVPRKHGLNPSAVPLLMNSTSNRTGIYGM